jgi:hypothetical protein
MTENLQDLLTAASFERPVHPSHIRTFTSCNRRWAYGAFSEREETQPSYQAEGTYGHAKIEEILTGELRPVPELTDEQRLRIDTAVAGLRPVLDLIRESGAKKCIEVTRKFCFGGIWFQGTPDLEVRPDSDLAVIYDWKFRGSIRPGLASERNISSDPQAIVYSWSVFDRHPEQLSVNCEWCWINKPEKSTPSKARKNPYTVTQVSHDRKACELKMLMLLPIARKLTATWLFAEHARDVPASPTSCAYGKAIGYSSSKASACDHSIYCKF